jgi:hypothetical protein
MPFLGLGSSYSAPGDNTVNSNKIFDGSIQAVDIANNTITVGKLSATGSPSSSTYLRGDGAWNTLPSALLVLDRSSSSVSVSVANGLLPVLNRSSSTINVAVS